MTDHCEQCGKVMVATLYYNNKKYGRYYDPARTRRQWEKKRFCPNSCVSRERSKRPIETRYCEFCNGEIPKVSKNGRPLIRSKYLLRTNCGKPVCVSKSHGKEGWKRPTIVSAVDRFLYAGPRV